MNKTRRWSVCGLLIFVGIGAVPTLATEAPLGIVSLAQPKTSEEPESIPFGLVTPEHTSRIPPPPARLWYAQKLQAIEQAHHCHKISQYQHDYPFYQLLTPEVLITWCIENSRQDERSPDFHLVIIPRLPTHPWASCPRFFSMPYNPNPSYVWIEHPPTFNGQPWPLQDMVYQEDSEGVMRPGPKEGSAIGPSLWYGLVDDSGGFLYCHEDEEEWLTGGSH